MNIVLGTVIAIDENFKTKIVESVIVRTDDNKIVVCNSQPNSYDQR